MARKNQYIKSKADYVLRKQHMLTNDGVIYENDKFTIMPEDGVYDGGSIITFSDSNFKFKKNLEPSIQKKIQNGKWIAPNGDAFSNYWTVDDCASGVTTTEYKIVLNEDCTTLRTFAYYGSAVELINATIKDIILHYPGGIYHLGKDAKEMIINGVKYYTLANDFEIDIVSTNCNADDVENPMRVLCASYTKYMTHKREQLIKPVVNIVGNGCRNSIIAEVTILTEGVDRRVIFVYLNNDGEYILLTRNQEDIGLPVIIPKDDVFAEMYEKLDSFSKILLNLTTNPIFTANFKSTYFTNDGYKYRMESYSFPKIQYRNFFSPHINCGEFERYYNRLMLLATFHDENDTFNIWRMMTHESIKNLDWSVTKGSDEIEEIDFDSIRTKIMLTLYGRQYDDLKRYADNIKNAKVLSYSKNGSMPDYFLTDSVENEGFDAFSVNPSEDNTIYTDVIYSGASVCGYTNTDANISFMNRLALNSSYIKSLKGTRRGIETMLNLFGLKNYQEQSGVVGTYQIHEYVAVANNFPTYGLVRRVVEQADDYEDENHPFDELPIALVQLTDDSQAMDSENYFIPWFDKNNTNTRYMYFQMNGGWKHMGHKSIDLDISSLSAVTSVGELDIYGETVPYMKFIQDLNSLTGMTYNNLKDEMVCYVYDISGLYEQYTANDDDQAIITATSGECFSHYFILKNVNLSTELGFIKPEESNGLYKCYGWRNVFHTEYDGIGSAVTCDGMKVLYLESIMNNNTGNNPHVGYGDYDDGVGYLEYFNQIFKNKLDNGKFSRLQYTNAYVTEDLVKSVGFNIDYDLLVDDTKCHYFISDEFDRSEVYPSDMILGSGDDDDDLTDDGDEDLPVEEPVTVPILIPLDEDDTDSDLNPNNWADSSTFYENIVVPENEEDITVYDEPASFSVLNVKNLYINFVTRQNKFLREYIENAVLPYLEHMIPSTTIFRYSFDGDNGEATAVNYNFGYSTKTIKVNGDSAIRNDDINLLGEYDVENDGISGFINNA